MGLVKTAIFGGSQMSKGVDYERLTFDYRAIGKRIKIARITQDISQKKLAEMIQVSFSHMSNIETGNAKVSLPVLVNIANALKVSISDLLCDNLYCAKESYDREAARLLSDCGEGETRIRVDFLSVWPPRLPPQYPSP